MPPSVMLLLLLLLQSDCSIGSSRHAGVEVVIKAERLQGSSRGSSVRVSRLKNVDTINQLSGILRGGGAASPRLPTRLPSGRTCRATWPTNICFKWGRRRSRPSTGMSTASQWLAGWCLAVIVVCLLTLVRTLLEMQGPPHTFRLVFQYIND